MSEQGEVAAADTAAPEVAVAPAAAETAAAPASDAPLATDQAAAPASDTADAPAADAPAPTTTTTTTTTDDAAAATATATDATDAAAATATVTTTTTTTTAAAGVKRGREEEEEELADTSAKRSAGGSGDTPDMTPAAAATAAAAVPAGDANATAAAEAGAEAEETPAAADTTPAAAPDGKVEETIEVPNNEVGRIIGKGGTTIRSIESISGAHVNIPQECEPGSDMRLFKIQGTIQQVAYCKGILKQKIEHPGEGGTVPLPSDGMQPGDPSNPITARVVLCPGDQIGRIIGKHGSTIRQIQDLSGAHMDVAKENKPGTDQREVTITGNQQQISYCEQLIHQKMAGEYLPPVPGSSGMGGGALKPNETRCFVPNEMVGRIIGKGGSTIRELQDRSGAHMDIAKECAPGSYQREVIVRGDSRSAQMCIQMLNQKIAGENPYGGPPQNFVQVAGTGSAASAYPQPQQAAANPAQGGYGAAPGYGQQPGAGAAAAYGYGGYAQQQQQHHHHQQQQQQQYAAQYAQYQQQQQQHQQYAAQYAQYQQQQQVGGQQVQQAAGAAADPYAAYYAAYYQQQATAQQQQQPGVPADGSGVVDATAAAAAAAAAGGNSMVVSVPNDMTGRIIGKAGATINEIQQQSGARVDVPRDTGGPTRNITITGDPQQVAYCNQLIQQKLAAARY